MLDPRVLLSIAPDKQIHQSLVCRSFTVFIIICMNHHQSTLLKLLGAKMGWRSNWSIIDQPMRWLDQNRKCSRSLCLTACDIEFGFSINFLTFSIMIACFTIQFLWYMNLPLAVMLIFSQSTFNNKRTGKPDLCDNQWCYNYRPPKLLI